ncbi:MAG: hypothetical protein LBK40_04065, partial [Spirochaetaceae bacterium]|nr:hypothetical protein [Spirochaetaceae bacterium]
MRRRRDAVFAAVSASILGVIVFLVVQRVWQGPSGFDIYYYALQTRAKALGGLLFFDRSLVYGTLSLLDRLVQNPVLSSQILSALSMGTIYGCLVAISFRRGPALYTCAVASIAVFNPAAFYQLLEFTKNNFSLAFFFIAYTALTNRDGRFNPPGKTPVLRLAAGLLCLAVSVLSHRMMLAVAGLFAAQALAPALLRCFVPALLPALRRKRGQSNGKEEQPGKGGQSFAGRILLCCGLALTLIAGLALVKTGLLERLDAFSPAAPLNRLRELGGARLLPGERVFYLFLQIFP